MVEIIDKQRCCGCSACIQICPKQCISLVPDNEGFQYPNIEIDNCINCGLCNKVCPIINEKEKRQPYKALAVKNKDKSVVAKSSSGGIFYYIAECVLSEGGVVFGAKFNNDWEVVHDYTEDLEGLDSLMTSKYVQSSIGNNYAKAKEFLEQGRKVLFSGTPCQIAGLHSFLRREYGNLLTMDFLCHGVPSPKVWDKYLMREIKYNYKSKYHQSSVELLGVKSAIKSVSFRNKSLGWKNYRVVFEFFEPQCDHDKKDLVLSYPHKDNPYMKGFLNNLYLRPSCHKCKFKKFQSQSDVTIGDFWSINRIRPDFYDHGGVSMVFLNTSKAEFILQSDKITYIVTAYEDTLSNVGLHEEVPMHKNRKYFFSVYETNKDICQLINKCVNPPFGLKLLKKIKNLFRLFSIQLNKQ